MSILDSVGSTPIVSLDRINPNRGVKLYVKLEGANPGGSVKDRIAHYMIKDAEEDGRIKAGHTILEPTSGAALWVGLKKSSELSEGTIVVILPDRGDRYLSTSLFTSVCAECPP